MNKTTFWKIKYAKTQGAKIFVIQFHQLFQQMYTGPTINYRFLPDNHSPEKLRTANSLPHTRVK